MVACGGWGGGRERERELINWRDGVNKGGPQSAVVSEMKFSLEIFTHVGSSSSSSISSGTNPSSAFSPPAMHPSLPPSATTDRRARSRCEAASPLRNNRLFVLNPLFDAVSNSARKVLMLGLHELFRNLKSV